ncbi:hypothetical protein [Maribacter litoralis]|uniref:hypothetical protein n=1 Tax=Maribacter litoralis TaxID=2059726 RepID=UPI003F5CCA92
MKTFKTTLTLLIFFLTSSYVLPQYGNVNGRQSNANFEANLAVNSQMRGRDIFQDVLQRSNKSELTLSDIEGEPYFKEQFSNGILFYKDSLNLGEFLIRYNAFTDEMESSNDSGNTVINKVDEISILLDNEKYVILNFLDDNNIIKKGFFIEKYRGENNGLFLKKYMTIKDGKEAKTSFHKSTPPSFVDHEKYYLKFSDNAPIEIKLKKNKVLNAFPDKKDLLEKFVAEKKLQLETEEDLIELSKFYNTLD